MGGLLTMVIAPSETGGLLAAAAGSAIALFILVILKYAGRLLRARGDILAKRLDETCARLREYEEREDAQHWDTEIRRFLERVGEVYQTLDAAFRLVLADGDTNPTDWRVVAAAAEWPDPDPTMPIANWAGQSHSASGACLLVFVQRIFPRFDPLSTVPQATRSILGTNLPPFEAQWRRVRDDLDRWGDPRRTSQLMRQHVQQSLEPEHLDFLKLLLYVEVAKNAGLPPQSRRPLGTKGLLNLCSVWIRDSMATQSSPDTEARPSPAPEEERPET
jgi:hypothetical protein